MKKNKKNKSTKANAENPQAITAILDKVEKSNQKQERADNATKAATVKKITDRKDLIYHYPADIDTLVKRKKFRTSARSKRDSFLQRIAGIKAGKKEGDLKATIAEYNDWAKQIFVKPELVTA